MPTTNIQTLPIASIRRDSGAQFRVDGLNQTHVANLAKALDSGSKLPAIIVFFDSTTHWLADGDHRIEAHIVKERDSIEADVREGTQDDAIFYGSGANADHGLPRSSKTKRAQVLKLLEKWPNLGVSGIAKHAKVSRPFVYQVQNDNSHLSTFTGDTREYTNKHGNKSTMNVGNMTFKKDTMQQAEPDPLAPYFGDYPLSLLTDRGFDADGKTSWSGVNMAIEAGAPLDETIPMLISIWPDDSGKWASSGTGEFYWVEVRWYGGTEYDEMSKPVRPAGLVFVLNKMGVTPEHLENFAWREGKLDEKQMQEHLVKTAIQVGVLLRAVEAFSEINSDAPTVSEWLHEHLPMLPEVGAKLFMAVAEYRYSDAVTEADMFRDDSDESFKGDWNELAYTSRAAWMQCDVRQLLPAVGEVVRRMQQTVTA